METNQCKQTKVMHPQAPRLSGTDEKDLFYTDEYESLGHSSFFAKDHLCYQAMSTKHA
jgi:hypothetical protein